MNTDDSIELSVFSLRVVYMIISSRKNVHKTHLFHNIKTKDILKCLFKTRMNHIQHMISYVYKTVIFI